MESEKSYDGLDLDPQNPQITKTAPIPTKKTKKSKKKPKKKVYQKALEEDDIGRKQILFNPVPKRSGKYNKKNQHKSLLNNNNKCCVKMDPKKCRIF